MFDAVVLSGGGVRGISHLGCLFYYYEKGFLQHITEYSGTSIGSVICLLLASDYEPMCIFKEIYNIESFIKPNEISNIWRIFTEHGIMNIDRLFELTERMIIKKFGFVPDFQKMYDLTNKEITVAAVNINKMCVEYFNRTNTPSLSVIDAVKMSCNLPLIFQQITYNGSCYVDGGLSDNFPLRGISRGKKILGSVIIGDAANKYSENSAISYIYSLLMIPINTLTNLRCQDTLDKDLTLVKIDVNDVQLIELSITSEKKMDMFLKGFYYARIENEKELLCVKGWDDKNCWDVLW